MPGPRRKTHLTTRDLQVLERLVIRRAEPLDALHERFFAGLSRKRALNRLGELTRAGFLHRISIAVPDHLAGPAREQSVYTLGPRARAALELRSLSSEHFRYRRWNPTLRDSSIPHQLATNRVADLLRADQVPEHLLPPAENKDAMRNKPDAVWERPESRDENAGKVLLEVDLGHYSRQRILAKLNAFAADRQAVAMLLIVPTDQRAEQIRRWLNDDNRHYHSHLSQGRLQLLSFDKLLTDLPYYADRYGSNPYHDPTDPIHWRTPSTTDGAGGLP